MTKHSREFTLSAYFSVVRRQRWLILLVALICGAAAFGISAAQKKKYSATASLAVNDPNQGLNLVGGGGGFSAQTPLQLAAAAAPQVTRPEVVRRVKQSLRSPLSESALRSTVAVAIDPNSYLVMVTAEARTGAQAARIANAFATADAGITTGQTRAQYRAQAVAVQRQLKRAPVSVQGTTAYTLARLQNLSSVATPLAVSTAASVPSSPSSPKPTRNTVAALIFGLFLGIAIAIARDALDRRLRHASDVAQELHHPMVGHIRSEALGHAGTAGAPGNNGNGALSDPDEESFRILRQNVSFLAAQGQDSRTVLVTSAMAQEGKSTVAAGLASAFAEAGKRTLLVECDLRRPVLAERFGIRQLPGLTDYLTGNATPQDVLQTIPMSGTSAASGNGNGSAPRIDALGAELVCITAGETVPRPAELLASDSFRSFLHEVSQVYDVVVLDTAPLLPVADTLGIVPEASTVLLCVRLQQTTRDQARSAQSALDRIPARPMGLVLTDVRENEEGYYGYYGSPTATAAAEPTTAGT